MTAERRHGRLHDVMREVARFWTVLWYVAFGLVYAHFDTSAPWWLVVFITLSIGTGALLGIGIVLVVGAGAWHSLWRSHGNTYPPDWLSRPLGRPEGYENYLRWTREQWVHRLRDDVPNLSPGERAEIMAMLREASEEHAAMLRAMLEDELEDETRAEILTELRKHDELGGDD
jgi:hypothetical protein